MNRRLIPVVIALVVIILAGTASMFTVDQRERALVFQLGEIKEVVETPGLHFKWPLIQNVRYFDNRILTLGETDTDKMRFPALSLRQATEAFTEAAYGQRLTFEHA